MTRQSKRTGLVVVLMAALVASAAPAFAQESAPAEEAPAEDSSLEQGESSEDGEDGELAPADEEASEEGDESEDSDEDGGSEGEGESTEAADEAASELEDAEESAGAEQDEDDARAEQDSEDEEDPFAEADRLLRSDDEDEEDPFAEPFEPTFGGRVELGWFFTDYERFNNYVLEPNGLEQLDRSGAMHIDLGVEAMVIRGLRVSVVGGASFNTQGDPSVGAWYVGLEPAYAVGDNTWEMAVGLSAMVGSLQLAAGDDEMNTSLTVLRPFFEVSRHFPDAHSAVYLRAGFNQWHVYNPTSSTLNLVADDGGQLDSFWLSDGGFYLAIGGRFGRLTQPDVE